MEFEWYDTKADVNEESTALHFPKLRVRSLIRWPRSLRIRITPKMRCVKYSWDTPSGTDLMW